MTGKHIVDVLLEERAPTLSASPLWPMIGPLLRALLHYRKAREVADAIAPMSGHEAMDYIADMMQVTVHTRELDRVPEMGRCIIVANHPTGLGDGFALYQEMKHRRPDLCFFANSDAHRVCPGFSDVLIPVAWREEERTRKAMEKTLRLAKEALEDERLMIIFPAGRLSRRIGGRVQDPPWEASALSMARKYQVPVVPVHVAGPFPWLFHIFAHLSKELRQVTLFHETLNKTGKDYHYTFGPRIDDITAFDADREQLTRRLKDYVELTLPKSPDQPFGAD